MTPLEKVQADEMQAFVENAIQELPEMQQKALVLFCIQKIPQKEVAEILECSVEMVKWNVFEARRKLRLKLDRLEFSEGER